MATVAVLQRVPTTESLRQEIQGYLTRFLNALSLETSITQQFVTPPPQQQQQLKTKYLQELISVCRQQFETNELLVLQTEDDNKYVCLSLLLPENNESVLDYGNLTKIKRIPTTSPAFKVLKSDKHLTTICNLCTHMCAFLVLQKLDYNSKRLWQVGRQDISPYLTGLLKVRYFMFHVNYLKQLFALYNQVHRLKAHGGLANAATFEELLRRFFRTAFVKQVLIHATQSQDLSTVHVVVKSLAETLKRTQSVQAVQQNIKALATVLQLNSIKSVEEFVQNLGPTVY